MWSDSSAAGKKVPALFSCESNASSAIQLYELALHRYRMWLAPMVWVRITCDVWDRTYVNLGSL